MAAKDPAKLVPPHCKDHDTKVEGCVKCRKRAYYCKTRAQFIARAMKWAEENPERKKATHIEIVKRYQARINDDPVRREEYLARCRAYWHAKKHKYGVQRVAARKAKRRILREAAAQAMKEHHNS